MALKAANDKSMSNITALPSGVSAQSMILLATETASSSATISFTSNIDSTYKEYVFKFIDIHPETDASYFTFQGETGTNTDNDNSVSGILHLYDPSSTTFVKHFFSICNSASDDGGDLSVNAYTAGYCNVTAAIDGVQFKFASGQIQGGVIKMYGVV